MNALPIMLLPPFRTSPRETFGRARVASRLAKRTWGATRSQLYEVKAALLGQLAADDQVVVDGDRWRCPGLLSLRLRRQAEGALHTHENWLGGGRTGGSGRGGLD